MPSDPSFCPETFEVLLQILGLDRVARPALNLKKMRVDAAHQRDQAVMVVRDQRPDLGAPAAGGQERDRQKRADEKERAPRGAPFRTCLVAYGHQPLG